LEPAKALDPAKAAGSPAKNQLPTGMYFACLFVGVAEVAIADPSAGTGAADKDASRSISFEHTDSDLLLSLPVSPPPTP